MSIASSIWLKAKSGDSFADDYKDERAQMSFLVVIEFTNGNFEEEHYDDFDAACAHAEDSAQSPRVYSARVDDLLNRESHSFKR